MDKYIVAMLQSKGALPYNDFFKSKQNCKKMSLIITKIIKWSAKDQNKLFDEVSKIPGIDTVSITSFKMSSLWKHPVEATMKEVILASAVIEKEIVLADPSEKKRLNWNKALYPAEV
eukprot:m51a1_g11397 hypothetical protein (117) ;mRNA; r:30035-30772